MAGTYLQIYVHIVFAVKARKHLLLPHCRAEVFKYISGIISAKGQKPIIVNGVSDHVHIFIGLRGTVALSDLVRDIKNNSSNFINASRFLKEKFAWQSGYGAFSYSQAHIRNVYNYILRQEEHHRDITFREEYIRMLKEYEISFEEKYL